MSLIAAAARSRGRVRPAHGLLKGREVRAINFVDRYGMRSCGQTAPQRPLKPLWHRRLPHAHQTTAQIELPTNPTEPEDLHDIGRCRVGRRPGRARALLPKPSTSTPNRPNSQLPTPNLQPTSLKTSMITSGGVR
jgi:hypothetical protein